MVNGKKTYYSISEVCNQTGLEPHVLRYWESEFPQLRPKKNRAGNRAYREKDIEIIKYIKYLLYDEQFTIPGAKRKIAEVKELDFEQVKLEIAHAPVFTDESEEDHQIEEVLETIPNVMGVAVLEVKNESTHSDPGIINSLKDELHSILQMLKS